MKNYNYKHGHPGIGSTGLQGIQGKSGNNLYIGTIDSFFVYVTQEMLNEYGLSDYNISYSKDQKRLHPKYKPNDVLYIIENGNITKSIELTDNHILCTQEYLTNSVFYDFPFALQYQDIISNDILHFPLNIVYGNNNDSAFILNEKYKHGLIKGSYYDSNNIVNVSASTGTFIGSYYTNIPILYDPENIPKYYNVVNSGNTYNLYQFNAAKLLDHTLLTCKSSNNTNFNIIATPKNIKFHTDTSFIKMNNLFIKNNNKGNIESLNVLYNLDLLLDVEGNAYTLNSTDYNIYTLKFYIDKTKFFKNIPENINDYHFGYIHTMYNSGKDNDTYKPNYIHDISYIECTYRDISKDADGVYVRNWDIIEDITDESIKELLFNTRDTVKLKDIADKLPDTTNSELITKYSDTSGIIVTYQKTEYVLFNVIKTCDLSCEYYQTDNENVSNFLRVKNGNKYDDTSVIDIWDSSVLEHFDPSYNSSIITKIDPEDLYISLNHYDKNILPYIHHNIVLWVLYPNGFKYYSNNTTVTYNVYDNSYDISVSPQKYITDNINENTGTSKFKYLIDLYTDLRTNTSKFSLNIENTDSSINLSNAKVYINNIYVDASTFNNNIRITDIPSTLVDINDFIYDSSILEKLYNSKSGNTLNNYSIPVMVEYNIDGSEEILYDYYSINSTGYVESRSVPKINLHIYDDIDSLEKFNNVNNGLLCNQFQFFIKVTISDFDNTNWGLYFDDLTLTFNISLNSVDKFTGNTISNKTFLYNSAEDKISYKKVSKNIDIFNVTAKELDSISDYDINLPISVSLSDDKEFYIRVLYECANPVGAILHFAYSVNSIILTGNNFTSKLLPEKSLYMSNHLYATIIPMLLIAEYNYQAPVISYNGLKMYGDEKTVSVTISPYEMNKAVAKYKSNILLSVDRNPVNWNSYMLKNRYLQDNIESITVSPININTLYEALPDKMYNTAWLADDTDDIYNTYLQICYDVTDNTMMMNDEEIFYYNNNMYQSSQYSQIPNNAAIFVAPELSKTVRTKQHISSLSIWNNEYKKLYYKNSDNPFAGHNSVYGNGYQYMLDSYDNNQYIDAGILPLADLKTVMEQNIFENNIYTESIKNIKPDNYTPDKLFVSLLKLLKWAYPKYKTENGILLIDLLDIDDGILTSKNNTAQDKMPYNLMYSIYPRILFNDETLMNIILMLRKPTVKNETDTALTDNDSLVSPLNVLN